MDPRLCVVGDYAWDVLIRTNTELLQGGDTFGEVSLAPGGSAANVAVWGQRCGLTVDFVGKIGRDRLGQLAVEEIAKEGVTAHFAQSEGHKTGSVAVFVDHTGERSMVSGKGADHFLLPSELPHPVLAAADHVHLTAWSFFNDPPRTAARTAAKVAADNGATLSFDPSSFQLIHEFGVELFLELTTDLGFDVLLPNKEEGAVLSGQTEPAAIAATLDDLYPSALVILKLDSDGALVWRDGAAHLIPPATNNLIDATGAGDSFAGAFLAGYLTGVDAIEAARFATSVAAWVIEQPGARPSRDRRLDRIIG